jgi:hypothetical protein
VLIEESPARKLAAPKAWPLTIVAVFFWLQAAVYAVAAYEGLFGYPVQPGITVGFATLDGIVSVALIVAGAGLLARNRACLTVAVILAGLFLLSAGNFLAATFFVPTPIGGLAAFVFVGVGFVQYAILRSASTIALFTKSS